MKKAIRILLILLGCVVPFGAYLIWRFLLNGDDAAITPLLGTSLLLMIACLGGVIFNYLESE